MRYTRNQTKPKTRVVVDLDDELLERVDGWAIPAGKPSRAAAIRHLLAEGLKLKGDAKAEAT